jgi:hypothetical protein
MIDIELLARSDFRRQRSRERIRRLFCFVRGAKSMMLSLQEARSLSRPGSEIYRGVKTIQIKSIVGSEGRSRDSDQAFLPRRDELMYRWVRVAVGHYEEVPLAPIKVFEVRGWYFVRDGNHRVSVARSRGAEFIDAEIVSLVS